MRGSKVDVITIREEWNLHSMSVTAPEIPQTHYGDTGPAFLTFAMLSVNFNTFFQPVFFASCRAEFVKIWDVY